jgi:hypothetical protein
MKQMHFPIAILTSFVLGFGTAIGFCSDGYQVLASKTSGEHVLTLDSNIPVINSPTETADTPPNLESFNKIYRALFADESVDLTKTDGLAKLAENFQHETSNGLFGKLKKREQDFHGCVFLNPIQSKEEQTILVSARILFIESVSRREALSGKAKVLRSETIFIRFNPKGIFKGLDKGIGTREVMR